MQYSPSHQQRQSKHRLSLRDHHLLQAEAAHDGAGCVLQREPKPIMGRRPDSAAPLLLMRPKPNPGTTKCVTRTSVPAGTLSGAPRYAVSAVPSPSPGERAKPAAGRTPIVKRLCEQYVEFAARTEDRVTAPACENAGGNAPRSAGGSEPTDPREAVDRAALAIGHDERDRGERAAKHGRILSWSVRARRPLRDDCLAKP